MDNYNLQDEKQGKRTEMRETAIKERVRREKTRERKSG